MRILANIPTWRIWKKNHVAKVRKPSTVITISIRLSVWWGKRWEPSFCTWTPFSDIMDTMVFKIISWAIMHSLPYQKCTKWIPKSSMVWPQWHCERCGIVGCGILRQIHKVIWRWAKDKWNERVLEQTNDEVPPTGLTQERRCAHIMFEGASIKREINFYSCGWSIKENYIWR
jgi:hypothetical protein